jgi:dolichol-phosphate mannosyltransferase
MSATTAEDAVVNGRTAHAKQPVVSLVIACYNEAEVLGPLEKALTALADRLGPRYAVEFVLVDDGSRYATWSLISAFAQRDSRVRGIALSRNFGHQAALTCGYDLASGEAVVSMDADLQDPPDVVPRLVAEWEKGADVVFAVRTRRQGDSLFKRLTAKLFYRTFRFMSDSSCPMDSGDFRLMSRRALDALCRMRERHRYVRGMVGWIGFRTASVEFERGPRAAGTTKYPLLRMLKFAADGLFSFSSWPLRFSYIFAFLGSLSVLAFLAYAAIRYFFFGSELVPGWTSLILAVAIFGFLNLICLGIIGEYIGRIYEQSKERPLYVIREMARELRDP